MRQGGKLSVRVGIGNAQFGQYLGFEGFHLKGPGRLGVIVAQKVQEAVDDEMGEMVGKALALVAGLTGQRFVRQRDVADEAGKRREGLELRKAQDIGRLVDPPPVAVEDALMGVVGQQDRDLGGAGERRPRPGEGDVDGALGEGAEALGPIAGLDGDLDLERRDGAQLALSSLAVAPS